MQNIALFPDRDIKLLCIQGQIKSETACLLEHIQPASLDLCLGNVAYRVRASFLAGASMSVSEKIDLYQLYSLDLTEGAIFETGCIYIVPLLESLALATNIGAMANPKSSTGRLDVFTRLITDYGVAFDKVAPGYNGPLYLEISPRTFPIKVRRESRLAQLRFYKKETQGEILKSQENGFFNRKSQLLKAQEAKTIMLSVDLKGKEKGAIIGYRAKSYAGIIDVDKVGMLYYKDFWEPLYNQDRTELILEPDAFYILASKEKIVIPYSVAGEMIPFDASIGEFRVHYAGFFDPGFGYENSQEEGGAVAVLEIRSHEVPFVLQDGQCIGKLIYSKLKQSVEKPYGASRGSSYQGQGLKLSKHFY